MMQQAQIEFGFEADNIPLMIEAIPVNLDSIILIITKVEDPEELDTRFSRFSPYKATLPRQNRSSLMEQTISLIFFRRFANPDSRIKVFQAEGS